MLQSNHNEHYQEQHHRIVPDNYDADGAMKPTRPRSHGYLLHIPTTPLQLVRATLVSWRNGSASVSGLGKYRRLQVRVLPISTAICSAFLLLSEPYIRGLLKFAAVCSKRMF